MLCNSHKRKKNAAKCGWWENENFWGTERGQKSLISYFGAEGKPKETEGRSRGQ